eukprot:16583-Heterococcus_DN1.PRE.6
MPRCFDVKKGAVRLYTLTTRGYRGTTLALFASTLKRQNPTARPLIANLCKQQLLAAPALAVHQAINIGSESTFCILQQTEHSSGSSLIFGTQLSIDDESVRFGQRYKLQSCTAPSSSVHSGSTIKAAPATSNSSHCNGQWIIQIQPAFVTLGQRYVLKSTTSTLRLPAAGAVQSEQRIVANPHSTPAAADSVQSTTCSPARSASAHSNDSCSLALSEKAAADSLAMIVNTHFIVLGLRYTLLAAKQRASTAAVAPPAAVVTQVATADQQSNSNSSSSSSSNSSNSISNNAPQQQPAADAGSAQAVSVAQAELTAAATTLQKQQAAVVSSADLSVVADVRYISLGLRYSLCTASQHAAQDSTTRGTA